MFHIGSWQLARSYSSHLLINTKLQALWRVGGREQGEHVKRNYLWLRQGQGIIPTPRPLTLRQYGPLVIASETYVPGKPLAAADITPDQLPRIISAIAPQYIKFGEEKDEIFETLVHGDLTHRNILSVSGGLYFIDGDRSRMAPPEFDVWLLVADSEAHRNGRGSHREFIAQLIRKSPTDSSYAEAATILYGFVPAAAKNRAQWPRLWGQFVARCLAHSVADCRRRGKSVDWLDGLI